MNGTVTAMDNDRGVVDLGGDTLSGVQMSNHYIGLYN